MRFIRGYFNSLTIRKKLLANVSFFCLLIVAIFTVFNYINEKNLIQKSLEEKLIAGASAVKFICGDTFHEKITGPSSVTESEHYQNVLQLNQIAERLDLYFVYTMILQNDTVYFTSSSGTPEQMKDKSYSPFFEAYPEATPKLLEAFKNKTMDFEDYQDRWGTFRSVFIPFETENGKLYMLGADITIDEINNTNYAMLMKTLLLGLVLFVVFFYSTYLTVSKISRPIQMLADDAKKISAGNFDIILHTESEDETKILANALNEMIAKIKVTLNSLQEEKATVELRIQKAIMNSETQKEYLSAQVNKMHLK